MGCGSSKEVKTEPNARPVPTRPGTAKPRPATGSAPSRTGTRSGKDHPSTRSGRPNPSRPSSRHKSRPPSANRPSSSSRHRHESSQRRGATSSGRPRPIPEEQPVQDKDIHHDIMTLNTMLDQHVQHYYHGGNSTRRLMGSRIIQEIIMGNVSAEGLSQNLSRSLPQSQDPGRDDHILELCKLAERIKQITAKHGARWTFEPWSDQVLFPAVLKDGVKVLSGDYL